VCGSHRLDYSGRHTPSPASQLIQVATIKTTSCRNAAGAIPGGGAGTGAAVGTGLSMGAKIAIIGGVAAAGTVAGLAAARHIQFRPVRQHSVIWREAADETLY